MSALEPILWLEADRMKTLDFSAANLKNQQDVVEGQGGDDAGVDLAQGERGRLGEFHM